MTERQAAFVHEFLKRRNGAEAAIAAGYSRNGAKQTAARLLTNVDLSREIDRRRRAMELTAGIERTHILGILLKIATNGDTDAARVSACKELNKMLGYHGPLKIEDVTQPPLEVHVHYVPTREGS